MTISPAEPHSAPVQGPPWTWVGAGTPPLTPSLTSHCHIQPDGGPLWGSALGTHSSLNHHLLQVFADVGEHWPLVWLLLPALQHQAVPGGKSRQAAMTQPGPPVTATTPSKVPGVWGGSVPEAQSSFCIIDILL